MKKHQNNYGCKNSEPLAVLNPRFKELRSLVDSLQLRTQLLDLKAVVLIGAYIIFQAVMYGQVNRPSAAAVALCQNLLFPACLSASASLAFWPVLIVTVNDCVRTRRQQESSFMEQDMVFRKICSTHTRRHDAAAASQRSLRRAFASVGRQRYAYVCALYVSLIIFALCVPLVYLSVSGKPL